MPVNLRERITKIQWDELCNQIDGIIQPLNKLRKLKWLFSGFFMLGLVASILVSMLTFASFSKAGMLIFLIPLCAMIGLFATQVYTSNQIRNALLDMKEVCEDTSKKYNHISFHLREDRIVVGNAYRRDYRAYDDIYIIVSIIQPGTTTPVTDIELGYEDAVFANDVNFSSFPPPQVDNIIAVPPMVEATTVAESVAVPLANPATVLMKAKNDENHSSESDENDSQSIESRLVNLEKIKHMISLSEYEEKKKEIILSEI